MRKSLIALTLILTACNSGTTIEGPTTSSEPTTPVAVAPVPQPTATPAVVAPENPEHDAYVKKGFYHVKNTTGIAQFYCAAAFGVLPGGEQGAGTNIYQDQGVRNNNDNFEGQAPLKASCQYKQIQVDLTQSKDCRNFDWHNVLAAEVYSNPDFIDGSEFEQLKDEVTYLYAEGQSSENWCGTRTRITWSVKKFRCSGQITRTEKSRDIEEKPCCEPRWINDGHEIVNVGEPGEPFKSRINGKCYIEQKRKKVFYEINSCTQERREKGSIPWFSDFIEVPCPPPTGICYYNVPGEDGEDVCKAHPGFESWEDQNHLCGLDFPGVSDSKFDLNPGQSVEGCLKKPQGPQ